MVHVLQSEPDGGTTPEMWLLSEQLCSLGLSEGPPDALEYRLQQRLREDLLTAIELMRQCFVKVHAYRLRLEQAPETGEEWLVLDVTLQEDVDAVLAHCDVYTDRWIAQTPWPERDKIQLVYNVMCAMELHDFHRLAAQLVNSTQAAELRTVGRNSWLWVKRPTSLHASRDLAAPDTVAISEATSRLIQGYFACHDLGPHTLRGVAAPVQIYRVLGESGVQSRLEVASTRGLTPLVGRESEVALLLERWEHVKDGTGQVVVLSGEAGHWQIPAGPGPERPDSSGTPYAGGVPLFSLSPAQRALSRHRPSRAGAGLGPGHRPAGEVPEAGRGPGAASLAAGRGGAAAGCAALTAAASTASAPRPTSCWRRSIVGSPRVLTLLTSRRPRRCWRS